MPRVHSFIKKVKGFSLVEVLLSIALFVVFVLGVSGAVAYTNHTKKSASYRSKAVFLADEGIEAMRSIRNENYTTLANGTYQITTSGSKWGIVPGSETIGEYTRTVTVSTVDLTTKRVDVTVSWPKEISPDNDVVVSTYLTNWDRVVATGWTTPVISATLNLSTGTSAVEVAYYGNYAFVVKSSGSQNLESINISNSSAPMTVSTATATSALTNVFATATDVYITSTGNSAELQKYAVNGSGVILLTPTPIVKNLTDNHDATSVMISGGNAYVSRLSGTTNEFNIVNATTLADVGSNDINSSALELTISGSYAYVATNNSTQEVQIINITTPALPIDVGTINISGGTAVPINSIQIIGNNLILGGSNGVVYVYNVATPALPVFLGSYNTGAGAVNDLAIDAANNFVFVAKNVSAGQELQILDISTPSSITLEGGLNIANNLNGIVYDSAKNALYGVVNDSSGEFIVITGT